MNYEASPDSGAKEAHAYVGRYSQGSVESLGLIRSSSIEGPLSEGT